MGSYHSDLFGSVGSMLSRTRALTTIVDVKLRLEADISICNKWIGFD